jgi:serine/threonine-protein kinase RsbW
MVDDIVGFIRECDRNVNDNVIFDVKVILNELFQNAIKHGNKGDNSKFVKVKAEIVNNSVFFIIEDEGEGYNYNYNCINGKCVETDDVTSFMSLKESGRGMLIVKSLCEKVTFNKKGNKVIVLKKLY